MDVVGDHHLAVVAQIGTAALGRAERRDKTKHLDASFGQAHKVRITAQIDADAVDQQAHPDPGPRLLFEQFGNLVAEHVAPENKGRHFERPAGTADDPP